MSEASLSCNEPLANVAATPAATPRKRRRFDRYAAPLQEDVAAANHPTFVVVCDKPDETHVQHRLLSEFLAARKDD